VRNRHHRVVIAVQDQRRHAEVTQQLAGVAVVEDGGKLARHTFAASGALRSRLAESLKLAKREVSRLNACAAPSRVQRSRKSAYRSRRRAGCATSSGRRGETGTTHVEFEPLELMAHIPVRQPVRHPAGDLWLSKSAILPICHRQAGRPGAATARASHPLP